jgi:hypothetical protein
MKVKTMINVTGAMMSNQKFRCTILDDITLLAFALKKGKEIRMLINDIAVIPLSRRIIKEGSNPYQH